MIQIDTLPLGALEANCYVVRNEGAENAMLIDTGDDLAGLERALEGLKVAPSAVVLTHGHFDHMLGAAHIKKAYGSKIYIARADEKALLSPEACLYQRFCETPFLKTEADEYLAPGELSVCGMTFTVIATPGHTPGGVCLYNREEGILFSGDTLFAAGFGRTDLPGGDWPRMLESLKTLLELPDAVTAYPGHGACAKISEIRKVLYS